MSDELRANPYVGLRPFFVEDSLYFYGRERQTAELLDILREHRFLSVVGSSGSGKSSLVRAGLLPGLIGGFLVQDRDRWRTIQFKPGDAPLANLAEGLFRKMAPPSGTAAALERDIREQHTDAVLRFLGEQLDERSNVFILVDQFEEIFAFRGDADDDEDGLDLGRRRERTRRRVEAAEFVDLLLRLAEQRELPIYVALTMRTDFLGECDVFYGLPEALNRGRYLVPRLTREQLRDAIECPAMLLGAEMAPRLLDHVLNELGDRADRLPMLQHALLRTWGAWRAAGSVGPIDLVHYFAAGGIEHALNQDAEGAMQGLDRDGVARVFKRLTDTDSSQRRVRSPARISELMAASGLDRTQVKAIVKRFEEAERNFVYRSDDGNADDQRVDISHESMIRQWASLKKWIEEEQASSETFKDLVTRSRRRAEGTAGLLVDPELKLVFDWRQRERPSAAWARRYSHADDDYDSAMRYLDDSIEVRSCELAEKVLAQQWRWKWAPAVVLPLLVIALSGYLLGLPNRLFSWVPQSDLPIELRVAKLKDMRYVRIGGLTWLIADSRKLVNHDDAKDYCRELPSFDSNLKYAPSPGFWRLPTSTELLYIYSPSDTANGFGRKLRREFHEGVTADALWSSETAGLPEVATVVDFKNERTIDISTRTDDRATAICVSSGNHSFDNSLAEAWATSARNGTRRQLNLTFLYAGFIATVMVLVMHVARRMQRWLTYGGLKQRFAAHGGRDAAQPIRTRLNASTAHAPEYAATWRRALAWWIDMSIYGAAIGVGILLFIWVAERRIIVERPDDTLERAVLVENLGYARTVRLETGELIDLPTPEPPRWKRLITGRDLNSSAFGNRLIQPLVSQLAEGGEHWFGTVGATAPDGSYMLEYNRDQWQLTKNSWMADVRWRFGSSEAALAAAEKAWVERNPPPPPDGSHSKPFPLRGSYWRYDSDANVAAAAVLAALGSLFGWLYVALQLSSRRRATLGMCAAGIIRTDVYGERLSFGRANLWLAYRFVSFATLGIGFLVQPLTRQRQTLHDRLAGSVVLRDPVAVASPQRFPVSARIASGLMAGIYLLALPAYLWSQYQPAPLRPYRIVSWPELGIEMFGRLTVDGNENQPLYPWDGPAGTVARPGGTVTVRLDATLAIAGLSGCPDSGCPVAFAYGLKQVRGPRVSVPTLPAPTPCDQPVNVASGRRRRDSFVRDLTFTLPKVPDSSWQLWIDLPKILGCGTGDLVPSTEQPVIEFHLRP